MCVFLRKNKVQKMKGHTFPETNSSHLKMDGWKTSFLFGWLPGRWELLVSGSVHCAIVDC